MIDTIYIEEALKDHPRTHAIIDRLHPTYIISIERYSEIFNRKKQNFRIQKRNPALILAQKNNRLVLPTPAGYGISTQKNYYFSHMLNCLYDCRYCFLQGMYSSAHYLLFVNFEDFTREIEMTIRQENEPVTFFSGYDCDSLALENVTHFAHEFLPLFARYPEHLFELRTKSINIKSLLQTKALKNVVVAFSLNPNAVINALEHKAPSAEQRLKAMLDLANHGWPIGLRFDPLIDHIDYQENYSTFFKQIESTIPEESIHSVSIGPVRFPVEMYAKIAQLYPQEKLFASGLKKTGQMVSYTQEREQELTFFARTQLGQWISDHKFFTCLPEAA